jgi:hypothetical protein
MFLSNPVKFLSAALVSSLFFAGCGLWRSGENPTKTFRLPAKKEYPYSTREPEVFQAEIVMRTSLTAISEAGSAESDASKKGKKGK